MAQRQQDLALDELGAALHAHLKLAELPVAPPLAASSSGKEKKTTSAKTKKDDTTTTGTTTGGGENHYDRWTMKDDTTVDYGYLSRTGGKGIEDAATGYYITTAINYTNGPAHIGHAYEAVTSDVIARYHRATGERPVYFLTGADEHGQKIAHTAADAGKEPIDICNQYVTGFRVLNQRSLVSYDDYLRTTSDRHKRTARELWKRCHDAGDIYLGTYSGWYNIREETFVTDSEAALTDYKDPSSGLPLKQVEEESYFFKMSKYKDRLIQHIEENPKFIMPDFHRNQILSRLKSDDLRDLSISRTTFTWGITVPEGFHSNHVMYVWVDALSNYLTGVNGLGKNDDGSVVAGLEKFWPADVHIIGKDILWFHTVIWPCLLMSAGVPLTKTVFAHGFVNDKEGKKMSKSLGNVVDPHDMMDKFDVDTFRWYLCKEAPYGGELSFSEDNLRDMHNADLCDTYGNLVNRATSLCGKYSAGVVPAVPPPSKPVFDLSDTIQQYCCKMNDFDLQGGAFLAMKGFRDVNGYLQDEAPWLKKGDEHEEARRVVVRATLEAIYALTHLLLPFVPTGASKVFQKLHTEPVPLKDLSRDCRNLKDGTKIEVGDVLYQKALSDADRKDAAEAAAKKKESYAEAQKRKKEAKAQQIAASKKGQGGASNPNQPDFTKIDIRVGKIVKVWNHESSEKLFCEQIDLGEDTGPREIASGLRSFYSLDDMHDRMVLVVCNLKPAKLAGFTSNGMVLAASNEDHTKVELIAVPSDAEIGERVFIEGISGEPFSSTQVKKKKIWESVAKQLKTGQDGTAMWDGKPIQTKAGPCKAPSLFGASIS